MEKTIATHPNGIKITAAITPHHGISPDISCLIPASLINDKQEHLENGRTIIIRRCDFFDGHMGVGATVAIANSYFEVMLYKMLTRFSNEKTLKQYLLDKGFLIND